MSTEAAQHKPRSLFPLLAMVAVFAAPALAAWFFFYNPEYLPSTRSNRGELIQPVIPVNEELGLRNTDGSLLDPAQFEGKWTLISLNAAPCGQACRDKLIALRQIRLALGETRYSVERMQVLTGTQSAPDWNDEFEGMHIAIADERLLKALGGGEAALERLYILDPMGNLMMRYTQDAPVKDTLKDMERLLKASKNWIKGASYGHR